MDYKEKYEMALEGIQEILGSGEDSIKMSRLQLRLQGIFPELKESEDERIRKAIHIYLDWLDGKKDYAPRGEYTIRDMIAWVEKQGEHANFRNKIEIGDKVTRNEDGVLVNLSQLKRVAKPSEKQCEQETICDKCKKAQPSHSCQDITALGRCAVEHEQKPADKAEPKFKVGDIIEVKPMKCQGKIFTGKPNKIIDITEESYILDDGKAYSIELQDGWKLSEQKPADKNIVETWKDMRLEVYQQASGNRHEPNYSDDTTKMFSLNDIDEIIEKMSEQKSSEVYNIAGIGSKNAQGKLGEMIKNLKPVNGVLEQDSIWSEEDELHIRELESLVKQEWVIAERKDDRDKIHKMSDLSFFLKTLKPQLKQEWSEEDEKIMNTALCIISDFRNVYKDSKEAQKDADKIEDWLKSLKDRYTWKPSDEQMKALKWIIDGDNPENWSITLKNLYNDLKKLKEE